MMDIVVVGSVNLDLCATVARLPAPGETVTDAELNRFPGGKGANQALAAKRLGANVKLIASVGDDSAAVEALTLLSEADVDLSRCVIDQHSPTGIALICVDPAGENHIVVAPGANATLRADQCSVPPADALIGQLEIPVSTLTEIATDFQGFFCVNLAPAKAVDDALLTRADLIVVNDTESAWYGEALQKCTGLVATTHGAQGATLYERGAQVASAKPPKVDAIDTVGAGDTFTAALTIALLEGQNPEQALHFSCAAAAKATTMRGAQPSLPSRESFATLL